MVQILRQKPIVAGRPPLIELGQNARGIMSVIDLQQLANGLVLNQPMRAAIFDVVIN